MTDIKHITRDEVLEYDREGTTPGDLAKPVLWSNGDGTKFRTRIGPNYKKNHKKDFSAESLYECIHYDLLKDETNNEIITEYASKCKLPDPRPEDDLEAIKQSGLPRLIVLNFQIPYARTGWGGKTPKEHGCSMMFIFAVKPSTVKEALSDKPRPAVSLLVRFVNEWKENPDIKRRMKALAMCDNLSTIGFKGVSFYKKYNGKPVIINKTGTIHEEKGEYLELETKVRDFKFATLKGLDMFRDSLLNMYLHTGFVIQAEDDTELPEVIFGCCYIRNLHLQKATQIEYNK